MTKRITEERRMRVAGPRAVCRWGLAILGAFIVAATLPPAATAQTDQDQAQAPAADLPALRPPVSLMAADNPNDAGHGVLLTWGPSPDAQDVLVYQIYRLPWRADGPQLPPDSPDSLWIQIAAVPVAETSYVDQDDERRLGANSNPQYVPRGGEVHYRMRAVARDGRVSAFTPVVTGHSKGNWIHTKRGNVAVIALVLGGLMVVFIRKSQRGEKLYIRPIPGLKQIDEAIGRATEMGRPILFVLGTGTAGDTATLAGYTILARVARKTAQYQTPLLVPVNDPVMMVMAQEVVKEAYLHAGRPESYQPDNIYYISAMQFPYVAAVNGLMLRERTATNFYMGVFHAESLLLAEAGSVTGSIQMSGTDQVAQIPFFVAATDYTLIGEELYAASAYLSQEAKLVGPLRAQDIVKIAILALTIMGVLELTFLKTGWIAALVKPY